MEKEYKKYLLAVLDNWRKELVRIMTKQYHHAKNDEETINMRTLYKKEIATCDRIIKEIRQHTKSEKGENEQ